MPKNGKNRDLLLSLILSLTLVLLANTESYYVKIGGFILLIVGIIMLIIGLIVIGKIILRMRLLIKYKALRTKKFIIPIIIYILALTETIINPFNLSVENFQSKTEFKACYEGTVNTAIIKFKENQTFDFTWIGWFAYANYYSGDWTLNSDTLIMNYKGDKPERLNDTLFIKDEYFFQYESDTLKSTWFYLGQCKGLN
ncbi:MAG: hypothetical protein R6U15_04670 [Candidatus Izemoplasmatales bacterium]